MKRLLFVIICFCACQTPPAPVPEQSPTGSVSSTATALPSSSPDLRCQNMTHVYNSSRLTVLVPCVHVAGIVELVRVEADGDYHVLVHVDPNQVDPNGGHWINNCNSTCLNGAEHGDLVTEPVCEHSITQADAVSACTGYTNTAKVPVVGQHVLVSGPWVNDMQHGWLEIHPATYEVLASITEPSGVDG